MKKKKLFFLVVSVLSLLYMLYKVVVFNISQYDIIIFDLQINCTHCSKLTMTELFQIGESRQFPNNVPRIVHYNYKSRMVPSQYVPLVENCIKINPNVTFVIWSDLSSFHFIKTFFPQYYDIYLTYLQRRADPLKKSDIIRYFILLHFGGIYMDLDTRCQQPLEVAMQKDSCILSREIEIQTRIFYNYPFYAMNSFMSCTSEHFFFQYLIDNIVEDSGAGIIQLTGPRFLTDLFHKYNSTLTITDLLDRHKYVYISPADVFSPLYDFFNHSRCRNPKGIWNIIGCKEEASYLSVMNEKVSKAVVVHLFYHLGYDKYKDRIKEFRDLSLLTGINVISTP